MKKLLVMFAILISGMVSAQQEDVKPKMSGFELSASGNALFAATLLGENIENGQGFSLNANYDFLNGGAILGPSISYASFGDVYAEGNSRSISSYGSAGLQAGFKSGKFGVVGGFELPFSAKQNEGPLFESMLSGKIKYDLNEKKNFGVVASYDYFFNKDTFYYTSQAGLGLYIKF